MSTPCRTHKRAAPFSTPQQPRFDTSSCSDSAWKSIIVESPGFELPAAKRRARRKQKHGDAEPGSGAPSPAWRPGRLHSSDARGECSTEEPSTPSRSHARDICRPGCESPSRRSTTAAETSYRIRLLARASGADARLENARFYSCVAYLVRSPDAKADAVRGRFGATHVKGDSISTPPAQPRRRFRELTTLTKTAGVSCSRWRLDATPASIAARCDMRESSNAVNNTSGTGGTALAELKNT